MATELLTSTWEPQNFFETTLSADCTDSDTNVYLNSIPAYSEGTLVINPDTDSREVIYYSSKDGTKVVCPANGRGYDNTTATAHTSGAKVIMAPVADWFNSLKTLFTTTPQGWTALDSTLSLASGYNQGNRSFVLDSTADLSSSISNGMRFKVTRNTTPPTQCADLEGSSSQYASKTSPTGLTFTDDFTCEAWVKLESYGFNNAIITRFNGTSGWRMDITTSGIIRILGNNAGSGNYKYTASVESVPLDKWTHIAAVMDMSSHTSATNKIYINGVSVPISTSSAGTNPTSLVQAGNLVLGNYDGGTHYTDGKLADVRVWSDIRTATEIKDNMYNYPSDTTGLVAHFKLNGDFNDSSTNANHLTASGGALATATDNAWNATEYGIITNVTSTQLTVFCPVGYGIPKETLTAPFYSTQSTPYGFPRGRELWSVIYLLKSAISSSSTSYGDIGISLSVPTGSWSLGITSNIRTTRSSTTFSDATFALSESATSATDTNFEFALYIAGATGTMDIRTHWSVSKNISLTSATTYYGLARVSSGTMAATYSTGGSDTVITAECAYL